MDQMSKHPNGGGWGHGKLPVNTLIAALILAGLVFAICTAKGWS